MICCPNELVRLSGGHRQGGQMLSLAVSLISLFCFPAFDCSFLGSLAMKTKKYFPFHHTHDTILLGCDLLYTRYVPE